MINKERGITLIALIITIIVMLILVAVTVNVAMQGGIFRKAKKAGRDTEEQIIYDQIVQAMDLTEKGKINVETTYNNFKSNYEKYKITEKNKDQSKIVFYVTGSSDQYTYTITENQIIIGEIAEKSDFDVLERYFLGKDKQGKKLDDIFYYDEDDNLKFSDDPETTDVNESELLDLTVVHVSAEIEGDSFFASLKYNNSIYKITIIEEDDPNHPGDKDYRIEKTKEFEKMYEQNSNSKEGKDLGEVTGNSIYNGWTILYDNGSYVEAVSPSAMGEIHLGSDIDIVDGDSVESNIEYDKAITSYDNLITTINKYCKELPELPANSGVRSVGTEKDSSDLKYCNLDPLNNGWANNRGFEIVNRGIVSDNYYEQDYFRMIYYDKLIVDKKYCVASRSSYQNNDDLVLGVIAVYYDEEIGPTIFDEWLFELDYNLTFPRSSSKKFAVRPIIKVEI